MVLIITDYNRFAVAFKTALWISVAKIQYYIKFIKIIKMTDKSFQIYQDQPFIPKDSKVMYNLWFIYPHRTLLSFTVESIDILRASAWLFIECICHCSFVLCCYQHGRDTANYCNYCYVTAMTFEMNTDFEKHFMHPFC